MFSRTLVLAALLAASLPACRRPATTTQSAPAPSAKDLTNGGPIQIRLNTSAGWNGQETVNWSSVDFRLGTPYTPEAVAEMMIDAQKRDEIKGHTLFRIDISVAALTVWRATELALEKVDSTAQQALAAAGPEKEKAFQSIAPGVYEEAKTTILNGAIGKFAADNSLSPEVARALYESNPAVRAAIDQGVAKYFDGAKPGIDAKIRAKIDEEARKKVQEAVDEAERRIEELQKRTMLQGVLVTAGVVNSEASFFFYLQAGKGNIGVPRAANGHTPFQNATGVNSAVEQLAGYQMTSYAKAALVALLSENSSIEVAFAGLHAHGRGVPFIDGNQWVAQNLGLTREDFDAGEKLFQVDTAMLQAIFRQGLNQYFVTLFSGGAETKLSVGARIALGDRTMLHLIGLANGSNPHHNATGLFAQVLVEHALTRRFRVSAGGGIEPCYVEDTHSLGRCRALHVGAMYSVFDGVSGVVRFTHLAGDANDNRFSVGVVIDRTFP